MKWVTLMNYDRIITTSFVGPLVSALLLLCAIPAQSADIATTTENSVGVSLSAYNYEEPGYMSLKATTAGIEYAGTYAFKTEWPEQGLPWFIHGDLRYANGAADYQSPISGSISDTINWYAEGRLLLGKDFAFSNFVLAPYVGVGLRHSHNDLRRHPRGYRRDTSYVSIPVGVTHKTKMPDLYVLSTTVEYIHLLQGLHKAKMSDFNATVGDLSMKQKTGHGFRLSTMARFGNISFGPSLSYWKVADSNSDKGFKEPMNKTYEIGIKASYHF